MAMIRSGRLWRALLYAALGIGILAVLFPFYCVFVMSSYDNDALYSIVPYWFGDQFWVNTRTIFFQSDYLRAYLNSLVVSSCAVLGGGLIAILYGYGVSKYRFRGKAFLTWFVIVLMMVPQQVTLVGYVMEMRAMRFSGSLAPLIFVWLAHPFSAYFMIQFAKESVPDEVIESGRIDGANEARILFSLCMPFLLPAFAAVGVLVFLWSWNNYLLPLIMVNAHDVRTLPIFIQNLNGEYREDLGAKTNAVVWAIIPLITVFSIFSKSFIKGIAAGSIKG
jgi:multiple sugar transport system permease protein/cellobiose transport system permease protein